MLLKAFIIFVLIRGKSNKNDSVKSTIALCQGEFSFAIFSLALTKGLVSAELGSFLILVTVLSMIVTPFMVNNIYTLASYFGKEFFESDKISPINISLHTVTCGFAIAGRLVAKKLVEKGVSFVIISDNLKHILLARERGGFRLILDT
jgi:CPA2 family monovalent cation:H+ antiporter-2